MTGCNIAKVLVCKNPPIFEVPYENGALNERMGNARLKSSCNQGINSRTDISQQLLVSPP